MSLVLTSGRLPNVAGNSGDLLLMFFLSIFVIFEPLKTAFPNVRLAFLTLGK